MGLATVAAWRTAADARRSNINRAKRPDFESEKMAPDLPADDPPGQSDGPPQAPQVDQPFLNALKALLNQQKNGAPKSGYKFWETQPVAQFNEEVRGSSSTQMRLGNVVSPPIAFQTPIHEFRPTSIASRRARPPGPSTPRRPSRTYQPTLWPCHLPSSGTIAM